jgi:hypothetical protein
MAIINRLLKADLPDFKEFLQRRGYLEVPVKGEDEVLRMTGPEPWRLIIIYRKKPRGRRDDVYVLFSEDVAPLVYNFDKEAAEKGGRGEGRPRRDEDEEDSSTGRR